MRKKILAANWKMNLNLCEAKDLFSKFNSLLPQKVDLQYFVFSPSIFLHELTFSKGKVQLGAQNFYPAEKGAFTGEISISHLLDARVDSVLIGHSERRMYFNESNEFLKEKVNCAIQHGFHVVFCCGESLEIRDNNEHLSFVKNQLESSLFQLSSSDFSSCSIAYEPIWAIGTGRTAKEEQIEEMHSAIRSWISEKYMTEVAKNTSILYGGSCNGQNAKSIFSCPNVDGGLIGGASLTFEEFEEIAKQLQI
jgi:triosephosphate isomerase